MKDSKLYDFVLALLVVFGLLFAVIGIYYSFTDSWENDIRDAAHEEGYEKGYNEGYEEGYYDGRSDRE